MKTAIIIPSRLGSTRLPRKPLRQIDGMTLVERVYRQCKKAAGIDSVLIATDSDEIAKHVHSFGAEAIMTPEDCVNGTERVAYAARHLAEGYDVIMNVQGDEPLIDPAVIELVAAAFQDEKVKIATPISPLRDRADIENPNIVKVVTDSHDDILYFSRSPIPHDRDASHQVKYWKHIGLYAFRRSILEEIRHLAETELENIEKLEQLRWLYHGYKIRAVRVDYNSVEVNTEEDVQKVEAILKHNS
ncbi:MAG: 3-deoxy-manno-octulosonate cytidylyltransferase [Bacteroidota bacterium]|nr:3-deoxy-manno-octulosonate cytidylyltransferase [Bacteroidota bacterium]